MDDALRDSARHWGIDTGYHDVFGHWHEASEETLTRLVAALSAGPDRPVPTGTTSGESNRAFQGDGRRVWALAVQLYSLRSGQNWGIGDFGDLKRLIPIAASHGAAAIALNPLHALFPDRPEQASPYGPNSRLFLNVLFIDVGAIPEFPAPQASASREQVALRATELVDYARVGAAKMDALKLAYAGFQDRASPERRADFEDYRRELGEALLRFACFECLRQQYAHAPWREWPQPWRRPARADLEKFRKAHHDDCEFQEFMQWIADRQLRACRDACREAGMSIGLFIDLAVGIDPEGADAWSEQAAVMGDVSVGAPPDEFNPAGQNWGLAPFNPQSVAVDDFAPMRRLMTSVMRYAGAVRIDHVLGLKRLFLIPRGRTAADGAYVHYPFEPLLRVIAEESNRHRCIVIGEDLGTVPDGFRETLARWGLWSYRVMMFEREHDGRFRPGDTYPAEALATFNTHDLPTLQGWMQSHDLQVKRAIGLDPGESDEARAQSQALLHSALADRVPGYAGQAVTGIARFLGDTPSRLVVISIEDVMDVADQVNIPGTTDQHPNWRRKLPYTLDELERSDRLRLLGQVFEQAGRGN